MGDSSILDRVKIVYWIIRLCIRVFRFLKLGFKYKVIRDGDYFKFFYDGGFKGWLNRDFENNLEIYFLELCVYILNRNKIC